MLFSRADLVVDLTYASTLVAPVLTYVSARWARRGDHARHRRMQTVLLVACFAMVIALEVRIRVAGGSGALLAGAPPGMRTMARALLAVHVIGAVLTYLLWLWLLIVSRKRYGTRLPGDFSRTHRRLGWVIFGGLVFTAASATGMYALAFVM